ncbi:histidine kinase [Actinoplanes sp. NPDC051633]|uniref:sensor histidine kinase n=1 Tax=Actinoplanes sp. NPDC051633 TaxID=3155670 RepID=UPI0034454586
MRPLPADLHLAGVTTAVVSVAAVAKISPERQAGWGTFAFALAFGVILLARRRRPVAVLLVSCAGLLLYYAFGFPPIGLALPVGAALYSAAEQGRLRWAVGAGLGLIVVSTAARAATGETLRYLLGFDLPINLALMGAAIALGDGILSRRRFRAAVLAAAQADRDHHVEQERLRVARDVHDVLAHTMSVVSLHADVAAESLDDADLSSARRALRHIREASSSAGAELRRTVGLVRSPARGLEGVDGLAEVSAAAGIPVRVRVEGTRRALPGEVDQAAYRVVQEAVTNARRHARPDRVEVLIEYAPAKVRIVVHDDGPASGAASGAGHGLTGMRERVELLGGHVHAGPDRSSGWRVEAVLPA